MEFITLSLIAVVLLLILYKIGTKNHNRFSSRGIKSLPAYPFVGSTANMVFRTRHICYVLEDIMRDHKEDAIVGMMQFMQPFVVVKDPELIKRVTVKDFEHFTDHQDFGLENGANEIFIKNLFTLKGEKWRSMRNTLSPAFTSNKLKNMFHFINQCGQQLADYLQEGVDKNDRGKPFVLEMKDLFTRFTNDVIATTAFGVHIDSLKERDNEFYRTGLELTSTNFRRVFSFIISLMLPLIAKIFRVKFLSDKEKNFFQGLIRQTINAREKHGIVRPDMIHLLMQAKKGELKDEEGTDTKIKKAELTEDDIAAQAMIFFFAGFDTASTLLSFTSILLAVNEDCQRKLQQEIDEVLGDGGELTYEKVQAMKYLDMVISESLRIFPPIPTVDRVCTKPFTIPAKGKQPAYTVLKGEIVSVPVYGLHHDPDYFPDPHKFDPERFSDENKLNIKPYTYMPFGIGPRLCIGQRLALLKAKIAIIHIMTRFNLVVVDKTPVPLRLHPDSSVTKVEGDFWMGATTRRKLSS